MTKTIFSTEKKEYKDSKELLNDLKSGKIKEGEEVILDETKEKKYQKNFR
jgi:hypothetical protein